MKFRQLELFSLEAAAREEEAAGDSHLEDTAAEEQQVIHPAEALPNAEPTIIAPATEAFVAPVRKRGRGRLPLRNKDGEQLPIQVPPDEQLFNRQYYGIGEVAAMFHLRVSVLRYWESEFGMLNLRKNRKGDRFFRPEDIKMIQLIHHLLREKKYTIEGAREYIRNAARKKDDLDTVDVLKRVRSFLVEMKEALIQESGAQGLP